MKQLGCFRHVATNGQLVTQKSFIKATGNRNLNPPVDKAFTRPQA